MVLLSLFFNKMASVFMEALGWIHINPRLTFDVFISILFEPPEQSHVHANDDKEIRHR